MTVREQKLTAALTSRSMSVLLVVLSIAATVTAAATGLITPVPGLKGLGLPSANHWLEFGPMSTRIALIVNVGAMLAMVLFNRTFNLLRTLSLSFAAMFMVMLGAVPMCMGQLYGGTLVVPVMLGAMTAIYGAFNTPWATRNVFLAFFLIACGALTQYGFVIYLPVMLMACGQMRVFSLKSLLAAGMGIAAPVWIGLGFGWIDFTEYGHPTFSNVFVTAPHAEVAQFVTATAVTAALLVVLTLTNLIKIYSYNLRTRAMNGVLLSVSVATLLMCGLDFTNMPFYYPMLCCCTAFQMGHFIAARHSRRSCYVVVLGAIAIYAGLWIWRVTA